MTVEAVLGGEAYCRGDLPGANPYPKGSVERTRWAMGWLVTQTVDLLDNPTL